VSAASAATTIPLILVLLTALLAVSLAGIVRAEPWTPGASEPESASQLSQVSQPELTSEPSTAPLPRRVAGQSGRIARGTGDLSFSPDAIEHYSPGAIEPPRVSGGPPWPPAPRPPGLP
jgi:hypothetical protein